MRRMNLRFALLIAASIAVPLACATAIDQPPDGDGGAGGEGGDPTGASASSTGSGPCIYAPECAHLTDACGDGACVNSACVKLPNPAKDGTPCDDGKQCTQNDACKEGACTGALNSCPSSEPCMVGLCDVETDTCIEVPGNDGKICADSDPCTQNSVCSGGVCSGGSPTDCSLPKNPCLMGYCEPGVGCKLMPYNEGGKCDDGLFCTVNDACKSGDCTGQPMACAPPGDVCLVGMCDEQQWTCKAVPGNNGAQCDDKSACTTGETCSNGVCGGGAPANDGAMCNDKSACTTGDVCQGGGCSGTPVAACASGDGCCPSGCDIAMDDDCGGMVYLTSANGSPGFYGYDIVANSWSALPQPPVPTCSQLTTDGTNVLLLGIDNVIYSYAPASGQWSPVVSGPGFEANFPIGFFKWTPSGYYYVKDSSNLIKYTTAGGNVWSIAMLPAAGSCAGTFDPASGNLYIRQYGSVGVMTFSTATNSVVQFWQSFVSCGESSRTGSYYDGYFYGRDFNSPFVKIDVATGVMSNTAISPFEGHTSTDVDLATGDIYIGPYKPTGQVFQVWNVPANTIKMLAPLPVFVIDTTLVVVK
jgi:hypothetical protein